MGADEAKAGEDRGEKSRKWDFSVVLTEIPRSNRSPFRKVRRVMKSHLESSRQYIDRS